MMTFSDVVKAVDQFSPDELRQLKEYIEQREQQIELHAGTLDVDELMRGLEALRAGLSNEEFREIEHAMNDEYVEPLDIDQ
jgi:hypothetical protein